MPSVLGAKIQNGKKIHLFCRSCSKAPVFSIKNPCSALVAGAASYQYRSHPNALVDRLQTSMWASGMAQARPTAFSAVPNTPRPSGLSRHSPSACAHAGQAHMVVIKFTICAFLSTPITSSTFHYFFIENIHLIHKNHKSILFQRTTRAGPRLLLTFVNHHVILSFLLKFLKPKID